jgi:hypothetical protein
MTDDELEAQMDRLFRELQRTFEGSVPAEWVDAVGHAYYERLRREAKVNDFIPLLVYRLTKEELFRIAAEDLSRAA